jgi:hypothetical protein
MLEKRGRNLKESKVKIGKDLFEVEGEMILGLG